ncbi:MAG: hypothetical protein NUV82_00920 [Candidatus Komeilibacteria bacterium]|nr:hypothetical protein [Candidatus Komeilibacteria bacterium]
MTTSLHRENLPASRLTTLIYLLLSLIFFYWAWSGESDWRYLILFGALLWFWLYINFRTFHLTATSDGLDFGFGLFRRRLSWVEISGAEQTSDNPYGYGIRRRKNGLAFLVPSLDKLKITTHDYHYLVSSDEAEEWVKLINKKINENS